VEIIFSQIANLGFPIVVSVFLLVRIESKLTDITSSINELTKAIISKTKEEVIWLSSFVWLFRSPIISPHAAIKSKTKKNNNTNILFLIRATPFL